MQTNADESSLKRTETENFFLHTPAWLKVAVSLDSYMNNVNRIGNLTLLEADKNKLVGRTLFK